MAADTATKAAAGPSELELKPIEGAARWLGSFLHPLALRMLSMIEQPAETMAGPLTPTDRYFRRDRHRHPRIDPERFMLRVTGVARESTFSLADLQGLPQEQRVLVMECAGNGNHLMGSAGLLGQALWSGPSLATVIEACGGVGEATHFAFHGLDPIAPVRRGYHYGLSWAELTKARALLALEMNGEVLPRPRGFPVRLVVPGIYSMSHVKWLGHIEGKTTAHRGIHNRWVFTNKVRRNGSWAREEVRWIGLKSMITRCQRTDDGWLLTGRAWGGSTGVESVDITTDGGSTWSPAIVHRPSSLFRDQCVALEDGDVAHAWSVFEYRWRPPCPGTFKLGSRARDYHGVQQPFERDADIRGHFDQTAIKWRRVVVPDLPLATPGLLRRPAARPRRHRNDSAPEPATRGARE
jgi:DMSO/TMAO reductase YedYZ molybdopterin-dependent catalytic subunit